MRAYVNTQPTVNFLSDEEQRALITAAQDVPTTVRVDVDGTETVVYGRTAASEEALTALVRAFSPVISSVARTSKVLGYDEAEAVCYERFILAVRQYDLTGPVTFSRDIRTMLRFEISDKDRTSDLIAVKENVAARYFRLLHRHDGDVAAAYLECKTTANGFDPATFLAVHRAIGAVESLDVAAGGTDDTGVGTVSQYEAELADRSVAIDEDLAMADLVTWLFGRVSDREETILRLRYGFDDPATENIRLRAGFLCDPDDLVLSDRQVAQALRSSTPTVNRLRRQALDTMRAALDELADEEASNAA